MRTLVYGFLYLVLALFVGMLGTCAWLITQMWGGA
jgi:hypothetical protein